MGVRDLTRLLQRFAPTAINEHHAHRYRGWSVAIDASLYIHRFVYAGHLQYAYPHVVGFYGLCRHLQAWKIRPIFVFDGEQRAETKLRESERRRRLKDQTERELHMARERAERLNRLSVLMNDIDRLNESDKRLLSYRAKKCWYEVTGETPAHPIMSSELDSEAAPASVEIALTNLRELIQEASTVSTTSKVSTTPTTGFEQRLLKGLPYSTVATDDTSTQEKFKQRMERIITDNHNTLVSLEKRAAYVTGDLVADVKRLIELWGFLHMSSGSYEAEAMCVSLAAAGISQATVSEDTDAAAFGDYPLLRYFYVRDRPVLEMNFGLARQALGMTKSQFLDMCILCGTDFSSTLEGIGPIRALKLIQKHGSIEEVIKAVGGKHPPRTGFDFEQARRVFTSLPPIPQELFLPAGSGSRIPVQPENAELMAFLEQFEVETDIELTGNAYYEGAGSDFDGIGPDPFSSSASVSLS
ncbi:PIN domain-like protein [Syncephalis fuscata]|nr:PIN domain-like protein [Syncephalis fuscata]